MSKLAIAFVFVAASTLTALGCKKRNEAAEATAAGKAKTTEATAAAPTTSAPVAATPGMDLTALITGSGASLPSLSIEIIDAASDLAAFKEANGDGDIVEERTTSDGWLLRRKDGDFVETIMQRKLGPKVVRCATTAETQAGHDAGRASCEALKLVGNAIAAPFKLDAEDTSIAFDGDSLKITRAGAESPTDGRSALADIGWQKFGKIVSESKLADGVSVVLEGRNGGIATAELVYDAFVRRRVGGRDLICKGFNLAETADKAKQAATWCATLQ